MSRKMKRRIPQRPSVFKNDNPGVPKTTQESKIISYNPDPQNRSQKILTPPAFGSGISASAVLPTYSTNNFEEFLDMIENDDLASHLTYPDGTKYTDVVDHQAKEAELQQEILNNRNSKCKLYDSSKQNNLNINKGENTMNTVNTNTTLTTNTTPLQLFTNSQFGNLRTLVIDNEPWFVGKDVASALGYSKERNALDRHVDKDDALKRGITDSMGRTQQMTIINESGLYSLILSSKLPTAKQFKHWVTAEVLPAIRKTGGYIAGEKDMTDEELICKALILVNKKVEERNEVIAHQNLRIAKMDKKICNQENIITSLTKDITPADQRAIIVRTLTYSKEGNDGLNFGTRYGVLYREFDQKFHMNTKLRYEKYNETHSPKYKSRLDFIDKELHMLPELFELTMKLFATNKEALINEWFAIRDEM